MRLIGLSPGSEKGVGPELMLKALADNRFKNQEFFWCGDKASLALAATRAKMPLTFVGPGHALLEQGQNLKFSTKNKEHSDYKSRQAWFLEEAITRALEQKIQALVTGPVEKSALSCFGKHYPGQTELLGEYLGLDGQKVFMVFMGGPFILSLLTTHVPLREVPHALSIENIRAHIVQLAKTLGPLLKKPMHELRMDMLALNPHAGEGGLIGVEDKEILMPALAQAQKEIAGLSGPWPADGYFAYYHQRSQHPDALIAVYHDQGLAPYKLLCKGTAVNVTLGLKIIRTSPAHGTADHLVEGGHACILSTINAINTAINLI